MDTEEIISRKTYLLVYLALLVLLGLTIGISFFDLGLWGIAIALLIAATKAVLIILYFMHVRASSPVIWLAAGAGFLWLGILLGLTFTDYLSRSWLMVPGV